MTPYDHVRLFQLDSRPDIEELLAKYFLTSTGNDLPAKRIFDTIFSDACRPQGKHCLTVLAEDKYFDRDHFAAYNRIYSHSHLEVPKTTTRLHFFSRRLEVEDLDDLEAYEDEYLGYSVVRPTEAYRVGRTVVSPPEGTSEDHILGGSRFPVNVLGSQLRVRGVPFMEQDTQVSACATACLWMISEALGARFGVPRFSTTAITEFATRYTQDTGRSIPSSGLSDEQILEAFRAMGHHSVIYKPDSMRRAKELLYWYVESEIPAALLLRTLDNKNGHVSALVGHGYDRAADPEIIPLSQEDPTIGTYRRNIGWIPYFLIHGDQLGPYLRMTLVDTHDGPVTITDPRTIFSNPLQISLPPYRLEYYWLDGIIAPLPGAFSVDAETADRRARRLVVAAFDVWQSPQLDDLVFRTYLIPSNEFKRRLNATDPYSFVGIPEALRIFYRFKPLPKYIWVTEISDAKEMGKPLGESQIMGEILIDPYSSPHGADFVSVHVPGHLAEMTSPPAEIGVAAAIKAIKMAQDVDNDCRYSQLVRRQELI